MADRKTQITEFADMMSEYGLSEAKITLGDLTIGYRKRSVAQPEHASHGTVEHFELDVEIGTQDAPAEPEGEPISSPMTGIYYASPSPSSPPFVKEGAEIEEGQIVGLIEAMKVFNEIPAPHAGIVAKIAATSGQLVQLGDVLMYLA